MSAYQRFLPRERTRTMAPAVAEVAEAAEVKAPQRSASAEALLKFAEARPDRREVQQASAGLQQPQMPAVVALQQLQQLQQGPAADAAKRDGEVPLSDPLQFAGHLRQEQPSTGIPVAWLDGVEHLGAMTAPRSYPGRAWQQVVRDAEHFLEGWAQQAAALGWPGWELFGCHRRAPWARIEGMGLILLLDGDPIVALTASEAVLRRPSGAHQTRHRKPRDPLTAAERCLIWELS